MGKHLREFTRQILDLEKPVPCTNQPDMFDLDLYWKPSDHSVRTIAVATAKEMCSRCPVKNECLNVALTEKIDVMIWGGLTPAERETLLVAAQRKRARIQR